MDAFDRGARFYELFSNAPGRLEREGPFLKRQLDESPGHRVADLACGTGIHALYFAEQGAHVHAYDVNTGMIEHARRIREHPNIRYAVHDMRKPLDETVDLIVCLGNSLCLLDGRSDLLLTFTAVRSALARGGRFVTQIVNYDLPANQKPRCRVEERATNDANVIAVKCLAPHGHQTYLTLTYFVTTDELPETVSEAAVLAHLKRKVLTEGAWLAGLDVVDVFGGYDGSPFDATRSNDLILICERRSD